MATKIITVSDLKTSLATVIANLEAHGVPVYVTQHGKPKVVLVSYPEYEALMEKLENLEDILAMKEAMESPEEESITLDEYERQRTAQVQR